VALDWWENLRDWFRPEETGTRSRRRPPSLALEAIEARWVPNDVFGLLGTPLLGTGLASLGTDFLTPAAVLARGWSGGRSVNDLLGAGPFGGAPGVLASPGQDETGADRTLAAWAAPASANGNDAGETIVPAAPPLAPPTATWPELGGPALFAASDPFRDPLADEWSGAATGGRSLVLPSTLGGLGGGTGDSSGALPPSTNLASPPAPPAPLAPTDSSSVLPMGMAPTANLGATPPTSLGVASAPSLAPSPVLSPTGGPGSQDKPVRPNQAANFGRSLALPFEKNEGQTDAQVQYLSRGPGFGLFLTGNAAVLSLARPGTSAGPSQPVLRDVIRLQFAGANANPQVVGQQELPSRSNYLTGADPSRWRTNVTQYGQVAYRNLYPGVDLVYYGTAGRQLEYDLVVAPGADPGQVRLAFQGISGAQLNAQGHALLSVGGRSVVQQAPVLYQLLNGTRQTISGGYVLNADGTIGFHVGAYDLSRPLYLDPVLSFSSYLGGSGDDYGYAVAVNQAGEAFVTGSTASTDFPTTTGTFAGGTTDAFVAKLNAAGTTLMYATYLGGSNTDTAYGLAVDATGNALVVGQTKSSDFPVTAAAVRDHLYTAGTAAFLTKLNGTGDAVLYSTFLGGSGVSNAAATAVAVDAAGNAYLTGWTTGVGFPTSAGTFQSSFGGGGQDAFVTEVVPIAQVGVGGLVYGSYLGGDGVDGGTGIAVDQAGNAFVSGSTTGWTTTAFPTTSGAYQTTYGGGAHDGFVVQVNASASALSYGTLLGGSGDDQANGVGIDLAGNAYVTGSTSGSFPTTTGAYQTTYGGGTTDAFVTKLNATGTTLTYSTYLGGSAADSAYGIGVDFTGNANVAGGTSSTNFPTANALYGSNAGGEDAFLTRLSSSGTALSYSTYLGGSLDDEARGIALDWQGNAYVTGWTKSSNYPVSGGAAQGTNAGGVDAFATKVNVRPAAPVFTAISSDTGSSATDQLTTAQNLTLSGTAAPGATVTVSRAGVGVLGSVTANGTTGAWSYDYSATTLAEGTYAFTATATVGGVLSLPSFPEFLVTVDRTAAALSVITPSSTASLQPPIRVVASDRNGLPNGTAVTLLVYDGTGTTLLGTYSNAVTLSDGVASFREPMTLAAGTTYQLKAQVTDLAGNQATSAGASVQVTTVASPWVPTGQVLTSDPLDGQAQTQLGDLRLAAPLDLDQSPGSGQGGNPALVYNSDSVSVRPIVQVSLPSNNNAALPGTITGTLTWDTAGTPSTVQRSRLVPAGRYRGTC
jgi:hypothetical protein